MDKPESACARSERYLMALLPDFDYVVTLQSEIFINDDNSSKINVIVEGITSSGIPVTGKAEYEVK